MRLKELIARRQEIDARRHYKRRRADSRHMRADWIRAQPGIVYFGGESVTLEKRRLKYVRGSAAYFPYTAGELARIYLDDLIRSQLHDTRIPDHFKMTSDDEAKLAIQAPLYFEPARGREGRFVYIDIAACYFELMKGWPLNVAFNMATGRTYLPRPEIRIPESDWDWLRREKPLRHALFGMLNAPEIGWYKDGQWTHHKTLGRYACPDLVALVKTQLRKIAQSAVEGFDCLMWLTDAGIFPERAGSLEQVLHGAHPFQLWLRERWGLETQVKAAGRSHLYSMGSYRVGSTRSRTPRVDLPGWTNLLT